MWQKRKLLKHNRHLLLTHFTQIVLRKSHNIFTVDERTQPTLPGVVEATTTSSPGLDLIPEPRAADLAPAAPAQPALSLGLSASDSGAPLCMECGTMMVRAGSCYACQSCGSTSGCS